MDTRVSFASSPCASTTVLRRFGVASMLLGLAIALPVAAQEAAPAAPAAQAAASPVEQRAVFIDVSGKVQWRPGEKEPWRDASVNDAVAPGVEVRTGLRSHAALRMRNATVLLDAGTVFQLPASVQDGDVLRTTAAIKHGRADFKVDKVGLSNDFKVVTPSTTLAVRGTEFAIATGALKQVEVVGARRNAINAIELKYALNNTTVQLSGNSTSSSTVNHPAHQSAVAASPPLASAAAPPATTQAETVRTASSGETPASSGSPAAVQQGNRSTARAEKASGNAGGGETSVVSRVQQQIADANARVDQAIAILRSGDGLAVSVEEQYDAILALRSLAEARRRLALEELGRHQVALDAAILDRSSYFTNLSAFEAAADGIDDNFGRFDGKALEARNLLVQIGSQGQPPSLQGGDQGEPGSLAGLDDPTLIARLREAIRVMAEELELAGDAWTELDQGNGEGGRLTMAALIERVNADAGGATPGPQARAAVEAYESSVEALRSALASGTSVRSVLAEALGLTRSASALVVALRDASPTADLVALANTALGRLGRASAVLGEASVLLAQIDAELATARADDDPTSVAYQRRQRLREVEAIYGELVLAQVAVVGRLADIDGGLDDRATEFASLHEQAGIRIADIAHARVTDLVELADLARLEGLGSADDPGAAEDALRDHAGALGVARGVESRVEGVADRFTGTEIGITGANGLLAAVDGHGDDAQALIADLLASFGGGDAGEDGQRLGSQGVSGILGDLGRAFGDMATKLGEAKSGRQSLVEDRNEISRLIDELGTGARADAARAIESYERSMLELERLVTAGAGPFAIVEQANAAVVALNDLIRRIKTEHPDRPGLVAAAAASLDRLREATDALEEAIDARDAIALIRDAARDDVRADDFGEVQALFQRLSLVLAGMDRPDDGRLATVAAAIGDRDERYADLALSGAEVLADESARLQVASESAFEAADQGFRQLSTMSSASSSYLEALGDVQSAAASAEASRDSARLDRNEAFQREDNARFGREATEELVLGGSLALAAEFSAGSGTEAGLARAAANRAEAHADDARGFRDQAIDRAADAARHLDTVQAFGATREQFVAAAGARESAVREALQLLPSLRGDIDRYDLVVRDLAARAGRPAAEIHREVSEDAVRRAREIAEALASLGATATVAESMAQTASTNAGRLFGRSVTDYVRQATLAYSNPNPDFERGQQFGAAEFAQQASQAANRAEAEAARASAAIASAGSSQAPPR